MLQRLNGTTLLQLWKGDDRIEKVTLQQLLGMRSGINDYNDRSYEKYTFSHPNGEVTPLDLLHEVNKTLMFEPGTGGAYSSINYELLGLVMVNHLVSKEGGWRDLDQISVLPEELRTSGAFNRTLFPIKGQCQDYVTQGMIRQYKSEIRASFTGLVVDIKDITEFSCLNGWTCGNVAAAARDTAAFYFELLSPGSRILSASSQQQMQRFEPLTQGWFPGLPYGLGLMKTSVQVKVVNGTGKAASDPASPAYLVGHGGEDWGSGGSLVGYNPHHGFGFAVAMGSMTGMNCSTTDAKGKADFTPNALAQSHSSCVLYNTTLAELGRQRREQAPVLNCSEHLPNLHRLEPFGLKPHCRKHGSD